MGWRCRRAPRTSSCSQSPKASPTRRRRRRSATSSRRSPTSSRKATGRHVRIVLVPAYNDVRAGLAKQEYDVAYIHPAHVSMAEIKAGRYKAVAWTTGFTEYTVSLLITTDAPLKTMDDLKGRTLVTPDPGFDHGRDGARDVPRGEADRDDATASRRRRRCASSRRATRMPCRSTSRTASRNAGATAANAVVKAWTDKGGKVLIARARCRSSRSSSRPRCPTTSSRRSAQALLTLRDSKPGREALEAVGYKGFVAAQSGARDSTIAWLGPVGLPDSGTYRLLREVSRQLEGYVALLEARPLTLHRASVPVLEYCTAQ